MTLVEDFSSRDLTGCALPVGVDDGPMEKDNTL
jgi:hypothetical protein